METDNLRDNPYEITYIGDAPNLGDMELIKRNLESALKIQRDYWKWKKEQESLYPRQILEVGRI